MRPLDNLLAAVRISRPMEHRTCMCDLGNWGEMDGSGLQMVGHWGQRASVAWAQHEIVMWGGGSLLWKGQV
jgi:hypothetical protein